MNKEITLSGTQGIKPVSRNTLPNTPIQLLRIHCISVRLNKEELATLNTKRGDKSKGEWIRMASLNQLPPVIPSINVDTWKLLGEISQQFNRVLSHLKSKNIDSDLSKTEIFYVNKLIRALRINLLNVEPQGKGVSNEGNAENQEG